MLYVLDLRTQNRMQVQYHIYQIYTIYERYWKLLDIVLVTSRVYIGFPNEIRPVCHNRFAFLVYLMFSQMGINAKYHTC